MFRRAAFLLVALIAVLTHARASAADQDVRWRDEWPRFRSVQYVATPLLLTAGIGTRYWAPDPRSSLFGGVLFDQTVADRLSLRDEDLRWATATATDAAFYALAGYRLLDSTLVPGAIHDQWDVAAQMTLIDLQAIAVISAVMWLPQAVIGRERPISARCDQPEVRAHESICDADHEQRYRSFVSGHVAVAVAAASLTCLHHANLPLYGGGSAEDVACGTTIGLASLVAVGRSVTLNHWATDVLLGALLGFGAGYVLPAALHYGFDGSGPDSSNSALGRASSPSPALAWAGRF